MSDDRHSPGVDLVRLRASDAARRLGALSIQPAHLMMALCEFADAELDGARFAGLRAEAEVLRARFVLARLDATALRRRIRLRLGAPDGEVPTGEDDDLLRRSPASRVAFDRADELADGPEVTPLHLLRAVLEEPVPQWAVPAADLGVDDLLAACFPVDGAEPDPDPPRVELEVVGGPVAGRRLGATDPARWLVGRARGCQLVIPQRADARISRHHVLLEVVPPWVRVQDLGSTNGTWVNDQPLPAASGTDEVPIRRDLVDGDVLRLSDTTLRVRVSGRRACPDCGRDLTMADAQAAGDGDRCRSCRARAASAAPDPARRPPAPPPTRSMHRCPVCGDVAEPVGALEPEPELCLACRSDPDRIVETLARRVDAGEEVPHLFSGYTLRGFLGRGGMGAVYLARDELSDHDVAVKVILPAGPSGGDRRAEFLREAAAGASLRHPNVVEQRENAQWHGVFYLVTEYCDGGDLHAVMRRTPRGTLPVRQAVAVTRRLLEALDYAHRAPVTAVRADGRSRSAVGLVHRDISPGNVLFSGGVLKVADFGLSKAYGLAGHSDMTEPGAFAGKHGFMPRRQVTQYRDAGPEVDVWAAAACLYFMLTGEYPRDFGDEPNEWMVVLERPAVPIRRRDPSIPQALADVIDRALAEEPRMSFATAADLAADLGRVVAALP